MTLPQVTELNDRAFDLFQQDKHHEALALFQQVFLKFSKSNEDGIRVQVARALYFAARCNHALGRSDLAEQIERTLLGRYKNDASPRTRYWAELAWADKNVPQEADEVVAETVAGQKSIEPDDEASNPDLDAFLDELLTTKDAAVPSSEPASDLTFQEPNPPATELASYSGETGELPAFLREYEVTLMRLHQIFQSAFMESGLNGDDELWIVADNVKLFLTLRPEHKLVQLTSLWSLRRYATREEKLEFANRINRDFIFVRAAVHEEDKLLIDCPHSYAFGMFPHQIVHAARLLARVARGALHECNENDLLA